MSLVLGLGLEHSCPWPREGQSSEELSLASDFFCVLGLGLGLEPCVLDSNSVNQIFHSTRCNTSERVRSWRAHLRVIAPVQCKSFRRNVAAVASRWQYCFELTGSRFKPPTSRFRDERVTARPTGQSTIANQCK